jgi:alpha-glucosidase
LPWTPGTLGFGFSPPAASRPWLPQPAWFEQFAVSTQDAQPDSTLELYRKALALRRQLFSAQRLEWLATQRADVIAFRSGTSVCVTVFDGETFMPPDAWGQIAMRSDHTHDRAVPSAVTAWLQT